MAARSAPPPKFDFSVIRRLREQHHLTLADLSARSRVSVPVISKLERNQTRAELDTLFRLARAFGLSATDLLAMSESSLAHCVDESGYRSGQFTFRQVRFANVVALLGEAPAGASVKRPEIHHDDNELCWILSGRLKLTLPHETVELAAGRSIQFDAILEHAYEALSDCRFVILHLRKDKRY
jgi:transcriptional regulator with XRE-family HTH domain